MEFRFGHLADYAGQGAHGKLILVGIFENIWASKERPVVLPPMYLVAVFNAHVTEGTEHHIELRFADADGNDQIPRGQLPLKFVPEGPRQPLRATLIAHLHGLKVLDVGEYAFHLFVDGRRYADLPLHVLERPNRA